MLLLAQLCHLYRTHDQPSHSKAQAMRTTVQRRLKPRTPLDCPICRLSCTFSSVVGPAPVRPWRELKSRRGAPKRINTEGFACPHRACPSFGLTDAHIHALVGDGKHGHAEQIQTFRCQACHTTFSARRHTPLYRLKTPSHQIAVVLTARVSGLDLSAGSPCFRLPATHHHLLAVARGLARSDVARALLSRLAAPAPPTGRPAHQAAQFHTCALALAGHRPSHEDSSRAPAGSPHAQRGASAHQLPATDPGRLSASHFSPVMAYMWTCML
jgi:hypothetical protein